MRTAVVGFYVLGLIAACSSWSCGSSNANHSLSAAETERIRANADDSQQSVNNEEAKRDPQSDQSDAPNRR